MSGVHFSELEYSIDELRPTSLETCASNASCSRRVNCLYGDDAPSDALQEKASFIKDIVRTCGTNRKQVFMCRGDHGVCLFDVSRNAPVGEVSKENKVTQKRYDEPAGKGANSQ